MQYRKMISWVTQQFECWLWSQTCYSYNGKFPSWMKSSTTSRTLHRRFTDRTHVPINYNGSVKKCVMWAQCSRSTAPQGAENASRIPDAREKLGQYGLETPQSAWYGGMIWWQTMHVWSIPYLLVKPQCKLLRCWRNVYAGQPWCETHWASS